MSKARLTVWLSSLLLTAASVTMHAQKAIHPGELWPDDRGQHIQAHGGGMFQVGKTYYWFGEDRSPANDPAKRYVACYSSTNLVDWKFRSQALVLSDPENLGPKFVLERPKVFFNRKTKTFVMYMHLDTVGPKGGYDYARVAVATSKNIEGPYTYVRSFRPLGLESRDIGQFVDDDGSAYLIFESRPVQGLFIARLSDDYMNVEKQVAFLNAPLEAGAIVHLGKLYYAVASHRSGWRPNPVVFATAPSLAGPWSDFHDIAPPETNTYSSQSSMLIKVVGKKKTQVIYAGDRWNPKNLPDSRYIWMPLELGNGTMHLPEPSAWSIDVTSGETTKP